jgi:hypothetical protein
LSKDWWLIVVHYPWPVTLTILYWLGCIDFIFEFIQQWWSHLIINHFILYAFLVTSATWRCFALCFWMAFQVVCFNLVLSFFQALKCTLIVHSQKLVFLTLIIKIQGFWYFGSLRYNLGFFNNLAFTLCLWRNTVWINYCYFRVTVPSYCEWMVLNILL